ncbi:hypothetical protein D9M68_963700 [compost metagenome]
MLADHGVVAFGQFADELVGTCQLGCMNHGVQRRGRIDDGDVLAHAAVEECVLLQHHTNLPSELRRIDQADVDAIDQQAPLLG